MGRKGRAERRGLRGGEGRGGAAKGRWLRGEGGEGVERVWVRVYLWGRVRIHNPVPAVSAN